MLEEFTTNENATTGAQGADRTMGSLGRQSGSQSNMRICGTTFVKSGEAGRKNCHVDRTQFVVCRARVL